MKVLTNIIELIIQYSILSNRAFKKGGELSQALEKAIATLTVYQNFDNNFGVSNTSKGYYFLLFAEAAFSGVLLTLLTESVAGMDYFWLKYAVTLGVYVIFMFYLTTMAASYIFADSQELIDLQNQIQAAQTQGIGYLSFQNQFTRQAKKNRWKGYALGLGFIATLALLGLFRNYLVNGSVWFVFDSPDDVLLLAFPILIGIALIYMARYKKVYAQLRKTKKRVKRLTKGVAQLQDDTLEFGQKAMRLYQRAEEEQLRLPMDANTKKCLQRMQTKSADDDNFFVAMNECIVQIKVEDNGVLVPGIVVNIQTASSFHLQGRTDKQGSVIFKWQATEAESYLNSIIINNKKVVGDYFKNKEVFTFDLADLESEESHTKTENQSNINEAIVTESSDDEVIEYHPVNVTFSQPLNPAQMQIKVPKNLNGHAKAGDYE